MKFEQATVHVVDIAAPGALVEIVDVLGDDVHFGVVLPGRHGAVAVARAAAAAPVPGGMQHLVVTGLIAAVSKSDAGVARLREELHTVAAEPMIGQHPGDVRAAVSDLPVGSPFPAPLALNVIPWVGQPDEGGFTSAELSVGAEVRKVLGLHESVPVVATLVQVPVVLAHSMALHARCARPVAIDKVRQACVAAPSLVHLDEQTGEVPTPVDSVGIDPRFVGRVRQDPQHPHTLDLFICADSLRRGAGALVRTAELLVA